MPSSIKYVGVITTDAELVVRSWDQWLVEATGLHEEQALGSPLLRLFPEIEERGFGRRLQRVLEAGVVEVLAPAFHQYLIRCPAPGAAPHFDAMQQHVTISPRRTAGDIDGLIITVEDVTARRIRERELAAQLKNQDETIRLRAARMLSDDAHGAAPLLDALDDRSWQVRQAVVTGVTRGMDADILTRLIETVRDHHTDMGRLNAALSALVNSSMDPVPHLLPLLASEHADVRTYTALTLGNLGDARATGALLPLLADADANVSFHAIEALGRIRARDALLALLEVAEARDPFLSFAALDALAAIGEPSAAPAIEPFLRDDELAASAASTLGELGDERSAAAIAVALREGKLAPLTGARALARIHERFEAAYGEGQLVADVVRPQLTPDAAIALTESIRQTGDRDLPALATVIGWLTFDGVEKTLSGLLAHAGARRPAVEALVARGVRATDALIAELASADADVRRAAALALGRIGDPRASEPLLTLLDDEDPATIIAAAGALGAIGNPVAFEALVATLGHDNTAVRHAVVSAINSIGHAATPQQALALIASPDERLREAGARIAGYFGYPECLSDVIRLTADPSESVRRSAVEHLAFFDDARVLPALSYALNDDSAVVRAAASRALAHAEPTGLEALLRNALADGDARVRYQAVQAVNAQGARAFSAELVRVAREDASIPVRIAAINALARFREPDAVPLLTGLAEHEEVDLAAAALGALGALDTPQAAAALERALHADDARIQLAALNASEEIHARALQHALLELGRGTGDEAIARRAIALAARYADDEAIDALIDMTAEPERRRVVIEALAQSGTAQVARIAHGLRHPDAEVRQATVQTLARMKLPAASRAIGNAVDDQDPIVRFAAVQALGRLDLAAGRAS